MSDWEDNIFDTLLALQAEIAKWPKRSMWMADDHPIAKHQRYLERLEQHEARRGRPKRRRL